MESTQHQVHSLYCHSLVTFKCFLVANLYTGVMFSKIMNELVMISLVKAETTQKKAFK
eukprot:GAHX01003874.1.p3 GENE.GAHX01003874.1~~GAHX01003874.1.p3  ORF type:complete len:58 (+),score=3.56 GAHX01003874.1:997-1170(+)